MPSLGASSAGVFHERHMPVSCAMLSSRLCMTGGRCIAEGLFIIVIEAAKADSSGCRNTMTKEVAMTFESGDRIDLSGGHCCPQGDRQWQDETSGDGSGQPSRPAWRVRLLRSEPVCRRLSERDGSGRQAACHQRCLHGSAKPLSGRYLSFAERE